MNAKVIFVPAPINTKAEPYSASHTPLEEFLLNIDFGLEVVKVHDGGLKNLTNFTKD